MRNNLYLTMKTTTKKTQCIEAWFKDHKKGQLENIWHKWTWIKGSSLRCSTMLIILFMSLNIAAQSQYKRGYPQRGDNFDVLPGFRQPPKGYGNVPFYWWSGDKLTRERLEAQLDILSESATDGFAISYIHTHPQIDSLFNKNGYGLFGRTEPGSPAVFSDDWWNIWTWFSGECAKRDVAAGLDDYTVGWIGNGYYPDEIEERAEFQNYRGKLKIETLTIKKGQKVSTNLPEDFLTAVFWPGAVTLDHLVNNGSINWEATENGNLYIISTEDSYILHPQYGKALVEVYFDRFEQKMTPQQREGMNYFFQDEMSYPIDMLTWTSDFPQEFQKRKGYDITPYLPALKEYIGPQTPKIRLDYAEVLTDLAEERYYRPIYDWHAKRGLIYGSDNLGRGKDPLAYVDYFHANSWYTAPGNDAPSKGSSFIQTKVSSSIAHLYNRPRTWLEAFHSMGWGSSGEWLTQQIDHHFMAGGNLVCMHGLYYSTHGGWWEWAPPCFHFRMPYWPHMKEWLKYTERMSYLLSQGDHVCDIALIYPTEPLQAYPEASPRGVFATAQQLSNAGLDYDFLDFRSLRNAGIKDKALHITNEKYRIIILSDMRAIHHSSLEKIRDFYRAGGIVLASGVLPEASSHEGEQDKEVDTILQEIFGLTAREAKEGKTVSRQTNQAGGTGIYVADGAIEKVVPRLILPDFIPNEKGGKVLHRRIGERDMYMVMNVEKGSECFFRSTGKVELWDATDGSIMDLPILRQTEQGTWIRMDKEYTNSYLIVFSPGKPKMLENTKLEIAKPIHTIPVEGEWKVKLVPTLNNQWGDYRLPASNEMIGAEARVFDFKAQEWSEWKKDGIFGYGPQAISNYGQSQSEEYTFSWEYGVWNNPGSQGYHGLKSKVSDGFFILDKGGKHSFSTYVYAPKTDVYRIEQIQIPADRILINGKLATQEVKLKKGWHSLVAEYENTTANKLSMWVGEMKDSRDRGAVVLLRKDAPAPVKPSIYDDRVSMLWTSSDHLMYDPYKGAHPVWEYRFTSVPGMEQMKFSVYGELQNVMVDNQKLKIEPIGEIRKNGINQYVTTLSKRAMRCEQVTFSVKVQPGYQGPIAIAEPIKISTGEGLLDVGDWSKTGALKFYSGGMTYKKNFNIPDNFQSNRIMLDLGKVSATCEIKVNGQAVGVRMSPPYNADITPYLKAGENEIEVLVYSTLANHYQTQPTPYRGEPTAGILGPVKIEIYNTNE